MTRNPDQRIVHSAEEMQLFSKEWAASLPLGAVVALYGDLGAGKTTFVRGMAQGIEGIDVQTVSSPTFTLLHIYQGSLPLYHFDLYRLPNALEFLNAGFDEYFATAGICCIEWADKISSLLPKNTWSVTLSYLGQESREISIIEPAEMCAKK
jgi:tRNA threonylcarbamoyladenosine biosynthesis protein TsaE